ncbi:MAG: hypothetical protein PHY93_17040 [Bacteriovorax sp.]|nr:hypothetical protein [Bacteriovorax sp.]
MKYFKAFWAGFFATLIFHQGLFLILNKTGLVPFPAYNLTPTAPFGVPNVISLSFFGGIWGILLWTFIAKDRGRIFWIKSLIFGALAPTLVAILIVLPIKGIPVSLPKFLVGLVLNGFWGVGTSLLMRIKLPNKRLEHQL